MARALTAQPKLLLLDEPVAGMNAEEAEDLRLLFHRLNERGLSILLIEHDMPFVMTLCHHLYVLNFGVLIAEGTPDEIRKDPIVLDAYRRHGGGGLMLKVRGLEVFYGPIRAVRGIDLDIEAGEIIALIGANGAGKTTTVRAIAGLTPYKGTIAYDGKTLTPNTAELNLRAGLALVPEGRGILGRMTVEDNLSMGTYCRKDHAEAARDVERMFERFPILRQRRHSLANLLSGGEQQMLAIARALLSRPRLLLLDEPSLGLAPKTTTAVFELISSLRRDGLTVLLVEQKARQTLKIADRAYLLETGRVVMSGRAADLANDSLMSQAFLGGATAPEAGSP